MKKALLILLMLTMAFCAFAEEKPLLTVLDFVGSGVSEQERMIIVDFISSHIVSSGMYRVIDRMQREAILKELEFSYSGCTDESCQLEVGKMLQAERIIVGSLGKVSTLYILNMKLIAVETGETILTGSKQYPSMEALINDSQNLTVGFLGADAPAQPVKTTTETEAPQTPVVEEKPTAAEVAETAAENTVAEGDKSLEEVAEEAVETALAVEAEKEAEREAEEETQPAPTPASRKSSKSGFFSSGLWRLDLGLTSRVWDTGIPTDFEGVFEGESFYVTDYVDTPLPSIGVSADLLYSLAENFALGLGIAPTFAEYDYIENSTGEEIVTNYQTTALEFRLKAVFGNPRNFAGTVGFFYAIPLGQYKHTEDYLNYEEGTLDYLSDITYYDDDWSVDEETYNGLGLFAGVTIRNIFLNLRVGTGGGKFMSFDGYLSYGLEAGYSLKL